MAEGKYDKALGSTQWIRHWSAGFFVASQGGQHPQLEPDVSTCFHTLEKLVSSHPRKVGFCQFFRLFSPIPKSFYLDHLFTIFILKKTKIHPKMDICHAIPRLDLNHLISYLTFYSTLSIPILAKLQINLNKKLFLYYFNIKILFIFFSKKIRLH